MPRAMYCLRQRIASGLVSPSCCRRARYVRVRGSQRNRDNAMVCDAVLADRSPPRFSRWRLVRPELAGIGATPQRAASECSRSGFLSGDQKLAGDVDPDARQGKQLWRGGGEQGGEFPDFVRHC
jgi:hypothetical protein